MATRAIIPRFLLPLQGPLWRGISIPLSQNSIRIRFASSSTEKPIVLEKPARFNPPSHGSRAKRNHVPKHYGPDLTAAEIAAQNTKNYPGMMAPEGTWAHFFWHSRLLHTFITMGTLFALGVFTFFMNYAYNSPYKDLVPPISDLWTQPIHFFVGWKNVILLHEQDKAEKAVEHRTRHLDDVAKRRYFMKMHGIETKDPVSIVFGKGEEKSEDELEAAAMGREPPQKTEEEKKPEEAKKKWLGIF
ncbi:hypothetical protein NW754_010092 [Fusarium falciforme]|uniref:Uncharacterized protein n=1 Tax=Fusarium falciforme TaxID=195108 RepID=A0A9W8RBJ5_9HYPO|nr:Hypothetical protein NCS54_00653000 [Fusarium falciforme]KAJ4142654.1 hypothetical protein NW754_010092 [Fusarium falciforme]KAJ4190863.1 hypothetical protein NW755_005073 [Fusarium falciforme]KAJ4202130.1 hypothetical protein NW767_006086 [Fusarium falciforme]KAJ4257097.1 hypothetical protein NW757_003724 [Fusarium falciforme]WAO89148.1 Hypothetical protein NCS54_00653000 [Fusarium falciforme]